MRTKARIDRTEKTSSQATKTPAKAKQKASENESDQGPIHRLIQRAAHEADIPAADLLHLQQSIGNKAVIRLVKAHSDSLASSQTNSASAGLSGGKSAGGKGAEDFYLEVAQDQSAPLEEAAVAGGKSSAQDDIQRFSQTHSRAQIEAVQRRLLGDHSGTDQTGTLRRKGSKGSTKTTDTPKTTTVDDSSPSPSPSPTTLPKTTVKGPTGLPRGGFHWVVQWKLSNPSKAGGWIIQGVNVNSDVKGPKGKLPTGFDPHVPYWEAWKVNPGQSITTYAEGGDLEDDTFANPSFAEDSEGTLTEAGNAVFYEGKDLPSSFAVVPKHPAGILPVAKAAPSLSGGTSVLVHNLTATWTTKNDKTTITTA